MDQRAIALRKWSEDGEIIRAIAAKWRVQGGTFDITVDVTDSVKNDGSLVRRIAILDPAPRYLDLFYYLRPDNTFQAHWGAGLGTAEFFGFSAPMYEKSIGTHVSMIFKNRRFPFPPDQRGWIG